MHFEIISTFSTHEKNPILSPRITDVDDPLIFGRKILEKAQEYANFKIDFEFLRR
jgi:hypothetical protein